MHGFGKIRCRKDKSDKNRNFRVTKRNTRKVVKKRKRKKETMLVTTAWMFLEVVSSRFSKTSYPELNGCEIIAST